MPTVTVPLATYNRARFLAECLDSILAQTHQDLEIIVVDDASTDETPEVASRYSDRIVYHRHEENRGFIETFKRASSLATGKYETYFGDDDVLMPEFIERGVEIMESDTNVVKFSTDCYMIDRHSQRIGNGTYLQAVNRPSGKVTLFDLFEFGCFVHGGINRRATLKELGHYDTTFTCGADYDLYLRMTGAGYDIYYLNEPLWYYRIHPKMRSHNESFNWAETISILERNLARFPEVHERLGNKIRRKMGMNKAWLAVRLFWEGQLASSLKYGLSATRDYLPAVPIGAAQMAFSKLRGRRSIYHMGD
ncbi:MAG: glycosyltransferase [Acidobacteriota bacterium]